MSTHNGNGLKSGEREFRERAQQIERLTQRAQAIEDVEARTLVLELLQAVMSLHADCLERLLEIIEEQEPMLLDKLGKEPSIGVLLALYGLHPEPLEMRVNAALDRVKGYLQSHNSEVELLAIDDSIVKVRLTTRGSGCGVIALKEAVEHSIYENAPEVAEVIAEHASIASVPQLVQLR